MKSFIGLRKFGIESHPSLFEERACPDFYREAGGEVLEYNEYRIVKFKSFIGLRKSAGYSHPSLFEERGRG